MGTSVRKGKESIRSIRVKLGRIGYDPVEKLVSVLNEIEEDIKGIPPKGRTSLRRIQVEALVNLSKVTYMSASDEKFLDDEGEDGVVRPMIVVKTVGSDK